MTESLSPAIEQSRSACVGLTGVGWVWWNTHRNGILGGADKTFADESAAALLKACSNPSSLEKLVMPGVGVRYIIDDVPVAIQFYTTLLGFTLEHDASPAFAAVVRDGMRLLLSGDGSSGKRPLADGRHQVAGGWNRIHLEVADLAGKVERLRAAGVSFRMSDIVSGPGGSQIILDDPSGNPVELFQPRR